MLLAETYSLLPVRNAKMQAMLPTRNYFACVANILFFLFPLLCFTRRWHLKYMRQLSSYYYLFTRRPSAGCERVVFLIYFFLLECVTHDCSAASADAAWSISFADLFSPYVSRSDYRNESLASGTRRAKRTPSRYMLHQRKVLRSKLNHLNIPRAFPALLRGDRTREEADGLDGNLKV